LLVDERIELPEVCRILNARQMYPRGRALKGGGNAPSFWYSDLVRKVMREPARKSVVNWGNAANRATGKYGPTEYVADLEPVLPPELWDAGAAGPSAQEGRSS
jgi:hypothetical protein